MNRDFRAAIVAAATTLAIFVLLGAAWTSTYDGSPTGSELASQIDELIQSTRTEVRQRAEVTTDFGQQQSGGLNHDDGRLHRGEARIFTATDCTAITATTEPDLDGNSGLDNGRMCYDTDNGNMYIFAGTTAGDPETNGGWVEVYDPNDHIASGMIVLRPDNTACPTGWTNVTATYSGLALMAADTSSTFAGIPDTAGKKCQPVPGTALIGDGCSGTGTEYDYTLATAEMPSHSHDAELTDGTAGALTLLQASHLAVTSANTSDNASTIEATGGGTASFLPLATFRLCQKD